MSPRAERAVADAVVSLVRDADFEIIPLKGSEEKVLAAVPTDTLLTVTCSVKLGLDRTLDHTERYVKAGYRVIPHLAARQVTDKAHLTAFIRRIEEMGVRDLYVIGGDAPEVAGPYSSAVELLADLSSIEHSLATIGIGCYPEGHPSISDDVLLEALRAKEPYANYMVSQLCFDPAALVTWLKKMRSLGIALPLHVGISAPMQARKLAELSLKIGVGTSVRYLSKQHGMIGRLLRGRSYKPESLLYDIGADLSSPELGIESLHLFSFNQVAPTLEWQRRVIGEV